MLCHELKAFWKTLVIFLTPIVLSPLLILVPGKEAACGYGVLLMAVYWLTEALPIAVTALLPMVLFPLLGLVGAKEVSINYMKDTNFVFMGGLILALSIEESNLHKRIALKTLKVMGSRPRWLLLGFMLPTWFLSMWISNTATTAMMIPVAEAVLQQIRKGSLAQKENLNEKKSNIFDDSALKTAGEEDHLESLTEINCSTPLQAALNKEDMEIEMTNTAEKTTQAHTTEHIEDKRPFIKTTEKSDIDRKLANYCKMLCLSVCYAANVGGTATMTGTATNVILAELAQNSWAAHGMKSPVTWAAWLPFGLPNAAICLLLGWFWLQIYFLGPRNACFCCASNQHDIQNEEAVNTTVKREYELLGPMTFKEYANLTLFITLIVLWCLRDPGFVVGYSSLFEEGYVTDSTAPMLIAVLLFVIPDRRPDSVLWCNASEKPKRASGLLTWSIVSQRLPWGPLLILGGGFALADTCEKSGLSSTIAQAMTVFSALPPWVMVLLITTLVAMMTEITSNAATSTLILPILAALAEGIGVNPLYLMLPATLAASLAFMLPVATPPNAIVFSYGHLKVIDMAKAGIGMNVLGILVVTFNVHTWGSAIFDLQTVPWANGTYSNIEINNTVL